MVDPQHPQEEQHPQTKKCAEAPKQMHQQQEERAEALDQSHPQQHQRAEALDQCQPLASSCQVQDQLNAKLRWKAIRSVLVLDRVVKEIHRHSHQE